MIEKLFSISSAQEYEAALSLINMVFQIKNSLPEKVFKKPFFGFVCMDFDNAMTSNFWDTVLQPIGKIFNDNNILISVLDPDPKNYFYHNFNYYNMLNLPIDITGAEYLGNLATGPFKSPADAILYNSETVVWVPNNKRWAIWGQRDYEICILAFADEQAMKEVKPFLDKGWKTADKALNNFVLQNLSKDFLAKFLRNYL